MQETKAIASTLLKTFCTAPKQTLAVAESLTAGNIQALIMQASGASQFFLGGITAYSLEPKVRLLGIDRYAAAACNCVSQEIAVQMAIGAARLFRSDWALATTGYAEPAVEFGAQRAFAFWAVVQRHGTAFRTAATGRFEPVENTRIAVQQEVAREAISQLVQSVKQWHKA